MYLNENELEVLRILWLDSPRKPVEIQQDFGWDVDNGTLRSILVAMVDAGILKRRREGKAFLYSPRVRRETLLKRMVGQIAEVFTDGSTGKLLMELVSNEQLSEDELEELRKFADEAGSTRLSKLASLDGHRSRRTRRCCAARATQPGW